MALALNSSTISAPVADPSHLNISASPISSSRSNTNLLQIPLEIRLGILHLALLAASYDFEESDPVVRLTPLPFNKPVITVNIAGNKHVTCRPFWGSESMTRLMRVNKQLYGEAIDVIYKSFAIHLAAWRPQKTHSAWVSWLQERNPQGLTLVQHFHESVTFCGDSELNTVDRDGIYRCADTAIQKGKFLASNFPNLKTVVLSSFSMNVIEKGRKNRCW